MGLEIYDLKIISLNTNGIRAGVSKGLFAWLQNQQPAVVCLQETKAQEPQLQSVTYKLPGYRDYYCDAVKKGYSGVAIFIKDNLPQPHAIKKTLGLPWSDNEGRYLHLCWDKLNIISIYLPSGTSGPQRQECKMEFLQHYLPILAEQLNDPQQEYIICGDFNIAHHNIDIKNWKNNQKNSGFLPEERDWLTQVFSLGYIDTFRYLHPTVEQYTWWTYRYNARSNNVGWRIDYQVVSPNLRHKIQAASVAMQENFSDHAPIIVNYQDMQFGG